MANTFRQDDYRPATTLGHVVIALLAVIGVCSIFYFIFSIGMMLFPDTVLDLGDGDSINAPLIAMGLIALLEAPVRLGCVVMFLIWLHRAFGNLSALKARNLEFSPGWAVGWWFIPFANLVKPFQVVRELYNESDPEFDPETGFTFMPGGAPSIIILWWATFLLSGFAHRIADALYGNGDIPESESFPIVFMIAGILSAVAAGSAIVIVRSVNKRQDERAKRLQAAASTSDLPPAPPVFDRDL